MQGYALRGFDAGANYNHEEFYDKGSALALGESLQRKPQRVPAHSGHSEGRPSYSSRATSNSTFADAAATSEVFPPSPPSLNMGATDNSLIAEPKKKVAASLHGCTLGQVGTFLLHQLLEVLPLRSKTTGTRNSSALFPVPTSRAVLVGVIGDVGDEVLCWLVCMCMALNSVWGEQLHCDRPPNEGQVLCLKRLAEEAKRFCEMDVKVEELDWKEFFTVRSVDYRGEEVKVARRFRWSNIRSALPKEDEVDERGYDVYRLIMNLIPLNQLCRPMSGDVDTLPSWSMMTPFFLQPGENLLVSSEDVKCFFYTLQVPSCWVKYLAFNKPVPREALPTDAEPGTYYLASRVLPMGFLNSVSLAQHVHRNLVSWSSSESSGANLPHQELRKDQPYTVSNPAWRVYLDNYDLLERVQATGMVELEGQVAPAALSLRHEYERWNVPRNVKKSVQRSSHCEMQGAYVDGVAGFACPRGSKLAKYLFLAFMLALSPTATQKEWQVVCGGLVYFAMFRRPLLGCLNKVWSHIESYNTTRRWRLPVPELCKLEVLRFLALLPLGCLDFRLDMDPLITCSDASTTGGGLCASTKLSQLGAIVAQGELRGERPETHTGEAVLSIGLFDGVAALRVALELQGVTVLGHVSVEPHVPAQRVVEYNWPGTLHVERVEEVDYEMVLSWSLRFSQATVVVLGAGPPCQGVSGLNSDRRGALLDQRSSLFSHVSRIRSLVQQAFSWCVVHSLMESVSSMDQKDRDIMSADFGCPPIQCDAGHMTWCRRPRLYWLSWPLQPTSGASCTMTSDGIEEWHLESSQQVSEMLSPGWHKVNPEEPFPTFTTSRPSVKPGRKPAGIRQCTDDEIARWQEDQHRFPPYQYRDINCVANRLHHLRVPNVNERELMLGFPLNYTAPCLPKGERKGNAWSDCRLTLLGNSWSVPVVAWLVNQLLSLLGLCPQMTPDEIMQAISPGKSTTVQGRLTRLPLVKVQPREKDPLELARKLGNLGVRGLEDDYALQLGAMETAVVERAQRMVRCGMLRVRGSIHWGRRNMGNTHGVPTDDPK
eukprot:Skav212859  [mRNA]  locus=scaffold786:278107:283976:+ [translate_table: standard]